VGFMRDIYQNAQQTLVFLSSKESAGLGIQWIKRLGDEIASLFENVPWETSVGKWEVLGDLLRNATKRDDFRKGLPLFLEVIHSEWFRRAWVYQEFIVSSSAWFLCGRQSISWDSLSSIFVRLFSSFDFEDIKLWLPLILPWSLNELLLESQKVQYLQDNGDSNAIAIAFFILKSKSE
jgi:hypothetical protein